ncbi:MAG: MurT ligase domain-containing protein [Chloroflexi bacterium]|nr:MurT ligase domain-containing protein [Chloroflexota bacterium]
MAEILRASNLRIVHNRQGANLLSGVTTALVLAASPAGRIDASAGVFEVDEAHLPAVASAISPTVLVLLNLFRDQLDRYGELDRIASLWAGMLTATGKPQVIVANADDPQIVQLLDGASQQIIWFGVDLDPQDHPDLSLSADARYCPCGEQLDYTAVLYGHLGMWRCCHCGRSRPAPDVTARQVTLHSVQGSEFLLIAGSELAPGRLNLPGLYNVSNAVAAVAAAMAAGVRMEHAAHVLQQAVPAYGRGEVIHSGDRNLMLWLVKNPAGFTEALKTAFGAPPASTVIMAVNDDIADGRDISWLWDVDFEGVFVSNLPHQAVCTGTRGYDIAVRLKYAGVPEERILVRSDLLSAIEVARGITPSSEAIYTFATYTAMQQLRRIFVQRKWAKPAWES